MNALEDKFTITSKIITIQVPKLFQGENYLAQLSQCSKSRMSFVRLRMALELNLANTSSWRLHRGVVYCVSSTFVLKAHIVLLEVIHVVGISLKEWNKGNRLRTKIAFSKF